MSENIRHFAVCVRNEEHEESLELRKIYEVLEDRTAAKHNMIRVIDEEGEDYLYPRDWFLPIQLPHNIEEAILELTHA
jgi:primosomal protein N'